MTAKLETIDIESEKTLKGFQNSIYMTSGIHKELAEERDRLEMSTVQLTTLSKKLEKNISNFEEKLGESEKTIQVIVSKEVQEAAKLIAEAGCQMFSQTVTSEINKAIKQIEEVSSRASQQIYQSNTASNLFSKRLVGSIVVAALVSGIVCGAIVWGSGQYFSPKMDEGMRAQLSAGAVLQNVWPKLDKKDQEKLLALYKAG